MRTATRSLEPSAKATETTGPEKKKKRKNKRKKKKKKKRHKAQRSTRPEPAQSWASLLPLVWITPQNPFQLWRVGFNQRLPGRAGLHLVSHIADTLTSGEPFSSSTPTPDIVHMDTCVGIHFTATFVFCREGLTGR